MPRLHRVLMRTTNSCRYFQTTTNSSHTSFLKDSRSRMVNSFPPVLQSRRLELPARPKVLYVGSHGFPVDVSLIAHCVELVSNGLKNLNGPFRIIDRASAQFEVTPVELFRQRILGPEFCLDTYERLIDWQKDSYFRSTRSREAPSNEREHGTRRKLRSATDGALPHGLARNCNSTRTP